MKGVIVYKSKYGSTRQYAEWLQEATGFDLYDVKQCPDDLYGYDVIVLGSSVCAGRLRLAGWIQKHWDMMRRKKVMLLLVNITEDPEALAKIVPQSLPADIADHLQVFPVGGRYLLQQMSVIDRTLIRMVSSLEKRPEVKNELLADRDHVEKGNLQPIITQIRESQVVVFGA